MKTELEAQYPKASVEVWAFDEHRLGLKPILRKVWSPIGERPIARVNHQYEWTYLYEFVHPASGETEWFIIPRVNVEWMNAVGRASEKRGIGCDIIPGPRLGG